MNNNRKISAASWQDRLATLPQYLIPQHLLSVIMHRLANSKVSWFKKAFIHFIVSRYKVNVNEAAETNLSTYSSFNAFFTRALREGIRPIAAGDNIMTSPVDGAISQIGKIDAGSIIQAKGRNYSVVELLGGDTALAEQFEQGQFATIYLSPKDYHRIHMPLTGTLSMMRYIPGKLFSVNPRTARAVPKLFARNERVVTVFETEQGPLVMVLVGAIFVGSMETVWAGKITPPYSQDVKKWDYEGKEAISLEKGQEMGRFNMGSTVVLLLPKTMSSFNAGLSAGGGINLGEAMM